MVGFYLKQNRVLAFGLANTKNTKFIVCAGSVIRNAQAGNMSIYRKRAFNLRKKLIGNATISTELIFLKAFEFKNISEATSVILGQSRSGNCWINAADQTYPEWSGSKKIHTRPVFKRKSRFTTNNNEKFLVVDVIKNRDSNDKIIYEYLLRPNKGTDKDDILVPEHEVIKSLKRLINKQISG